MKKEKTCIESSLFYTLSDIFGKLGNVTIKELLQDFASGRINKELLEEELCSWITNVFPEEDAENPPVAYLVEIGGGTYLLNNILSLEKVEKYSFSKNRMQYLLLMNRSNSDKVMYGNTYFTFDTKEARDKTLNLIKDKLAMVGKKII